AEGLAADQIGHDPADQPSEDAGEREIASKTPSTSQQAGDDHESDAPQGAQLEQRLEEALERIGQLVERLEDRVFEMRGMVVMERAHHDQHRADDEPQRVGGTTPI